MDVGATTANASCPDGGGSNIDDVDWTTEGSVIDAAELLLSFRSLSRSGSYANDGGGRSSRDGPAGVAAAAGACPSCSRGGGSDSMAWEVEQPCGDS